MFWERHSYCILKSRSEVCLSVTIETVFTTSVPSNPSRGMILPPHSRLGKTYLSDARSLDASSVLLHVPAAWRPYRCSSNGG